MKKIMFTLVSFLMFQSIAVAGLQDTDHGQNKVLAYGTFQSVGQKQTQGELMIEKRANGLVLAFAKNFMTQQGPDLRVVLRDSKNMTPMMIVSPLIGFDGQQEYALTISDSELAQFDQVVIYCAEFHVDFGIATLGTH